MNETDVRGLLPRIRNKLEEYGAFGKKSRVLFHKTSTTFAQVPTPWDISVDELNFYFALGMGLYPKISAFVEFKSHEEENHEQNPETSS